MSKKHRNAVSRISPHLFLSLSVACACQSVSAQELERITVRAQYKEEDLQTVPIAITALSEKDIELRNMQDSMSLNEAVPNINVAKNVGASSGMKVFLRGIGEDESRAGVDPAVGVYVDDVYIGRQTGALLDLADIQSLEVLRGPQGTLYGRNSNGGAIRVTTKQPTLSDQTVLKTSIGSSDLVQGYLMVNKALTDKLAAQVAVFSKSRQGFITNTDTGDQLGDVDRLGARVATRYYGDTWDIQWSADFLRDNSDPGYPTRPEDANSDLFVINQAMFPLGGTINGDTELGEYYNHLYQSGTSLKAHRELDNGVSVESLTSYRRLTQQMLTIVSLTFFQDIAQNQFSQEVRFAKDTDDYSWVSGVFLFREDADQFTQYIFGSADIDLLTESAAVFGQYTYNVNDRLHLTGGLRYTWESKEFDADASDDYWSSLAQTNEGLSEETWGNLSWKGVVGYDFSEDAFGYLSVTTGFKSGGWSPDSFAVVDDESVVTYEVGVKSDISKALRVNVNAFYNDYTNLQVSGTTPNGFTRLNAGDVETYGVEASVTWQATEDLTIDAYVGTLEAKYVTITEEALAFIDKSSELKQAPPLSYGVNFNYVTELGEGQLIYNAQYSYTDKQYNDLSNSEIISRKATDILNGRIAYKWGTEIEYNVALWVKNAFDEEYAAAGTSGTVYPGDPRTYGLDFSFNF